MLPTGSLLCIEDIRVIADLNCWEITTWYALKMSEYCHDERTRHLFVNAVINLLQTNLWQFQKYQFYVLLKKKKRFSKISCYLYNTRRIQFWIPATFWIGRLKREPRPLKWNRHFLNCIEFLCFIKEDNHHWALQTFLRDTFRLIIHVSNRGGL